MNKSALAASATVAFALALTGCGSSDGDGAGPSSETSPSRPSGFDTNQFSKIQDCLKAAGLASDLPSGIPSDIPSDLPTNPSERPTGIPSDGSGGGLAQLNNPQIQEALKACGIALPQFGATAPPS